MFFGKKPQPSPPWVKWLLLGFLAVAVLANAQKGTPAQKAIEQAGENLAPSKLLPVDDYKTKIFPDVKKHEPATTPEPESKPE